jgi:hypothetical protein
MIPTCSGRDNTKLRGERGGRRHILQCLDQPNDVRPHRAVLQPDRYNFVPSSVSVDQPVNETADHLGYDLNPAAQHPVAGFVQKPLAARQFQ